MVRIRIHTKTLGSRFTASRSDPYLSSQLVFCVLVLPFRLILRGYHVTPLSTYHRGGRQSQDCGQEEGSGEAAVRRVCLSGQGKITTITACQFFLLASKSSAAFTLAWTYNYPCLLAQPLVPLNSTTSASQLNHS